jgi:hypothetical protein
VFVVAVAAPLGDTRTPVVLVTVPEILQVGTAVAVKSIPLTVVPLTATVALPGLNAKPAFEGVTV